MTDTGDRSVTGETPARRRGRRAGTSDTRAAIVDAARTRFAEDGYDRASLRSIARAASVDAALVHHYFADKADLFVAAMHLPLRPHEIVGRVIAGDRDALGERLVGTFFGVWDSPLGRESIRALLRGAVSHDAAARMLREFLTREVFGKLAIAVSAPDADLRGALVASQMVGLAVTRYIIRLEPIASAPTSDLVAWIGPTVQRYLTADSPNGGTQGS